MSPTDAAVTAHPIAGDGLEARPGEDPEGRVGLRLARESEVPREVGRGGTDTRSISGIPGAAAVSVALDVESPGLLLDGAAKGVVVAHELTNASFRPARVHTRTGATVGYDLMEVAEATDELIDVPRSTFMAVNPYLGAVEGRIRPSSVSELRDRVTALALHPEMAGWEIRPTEVHLRGHADVFRLPTHSAIVMSALLCGALDAAGINGLEPRPSAFSVTVGPDW